MTAGRKRTAALTLAMMLAACTSEPEEQDRDNSADTVAETVTKAPGPSARARSRWSLGTGESGSTLTLTAEGARPILRVSCQVGRAELRVNVPGFRPIGSEERLSFGGGTDPLVLAADVGGDRRLGGVTGTGEIPRNLAALIGEPIAASYGAQTIGVHPAPAAAMVGRFVRVCEGEPAERPPAGQKGGAGACATQDGQALAVGSLRATGTEPFWSATTEGRCVTYVHPGDQAGTRIWTRYVADGEGGRWSGALDGRLFELRTHPAPECSDGMSDKSYTLAAELTVNGERRRGCATPAG